VTPANERLPPFEAVYSGFQVVGNGSFGVVCLAKDMKRNENVAIKIVFQDRRYKVISLLHLNLYPIFFLESRVGYHENLKSSECGAAERIFLQN
jgi:serine/threonine protein kinase